MKHLPALLILLAVSACAGNDPKPVVRIPQALLDPVVYPMMIGTTEADVVLLISRLKAGIDLGNSKLAAIACIYDVQKAITLGDPVPDCGAG